MPSEYRLKRRVQFYETDMAGLVHFSWFFRYLEEAEHAMWREAGLSIAGGGGIGWPRVEASFEFYRPLRFEDEFEVHVRIIGKVRRDHLEGRRARRDRQDGDQMRHQETGRTDEVDGYSARDRRAFPGGARRLRCPTSSSRRSSSSSSR
jgi:hypothetical protein